MDGLMHALSSLASAALQATSADSVLPRLLGSQRADASMVGASRWTDRTTNQPPGLNWHRRCSFRDDGGLAEALASVGDVIQICLHLDRWIDTAYHALSLASLLATGNWTFKLPTDR
ncbi:unnamed protein product [Protopolystoma xenopodis]|uniref:Uncharacterized protein n=1 Tax=Protopolystoma xenopodis TaxID=117903 RepID=A0A448WT71_9PLAT|nr:unnamed protein product [Protopolystoma xenopodis]